MDNKHLDKKNLIEKIKTQLAADHKSAQAAAIATYDAATNEESKAENEYDTRGLEASYLAGAQAKRVTEIEEQLTMLKFLEVRSFNDNTPIAASALIQVEHQNKKQWLFMLPLGGGMHIEFAGMQIQTVTPASPLGEALMGLCQGDSAIIDRGNKTLEYDILSVL